MSDQHIQRSIIQAIDIIAEKRVSQASFDKTIKAVVKEQKDRATGEYLIKYQDSEFTAYATNSDKNYSPGQEVYILIPGNDWSRVKTIIGSSNSKATTFVEVPIIGQNYNKIGTNLISLNGQGNLCSYVETPPTNLSVTIDNQSARRYISQGDSIALGMTVKTSLASSQVGGIYGIIANLRFRNQDVIEEDTIVNGEVIKTKEQKQYENAIIRSYMVSSKDVIGNPYSLVGQTYVEALIQDINIDQFLGIDSIQKFCDGFPQDETKKDIQDIFISHVYLFGAEALTQQDLNGYLVHIDYSQNGNVLYKIGTEGGKPDDSLPVTAQLKVKGKTVLKDVQYYWFRENGLIFRGDPKYYSRAGEGWECLNRYAGASPVPLQTGKFVFNGSNQDLPGVSAALREKVNRIRCVVVYQNNTFVGDCILYNHNLKQVIITSSDLIEGQNKTVYYLNNGSPTLTCKIFDQNGQLYQNNNLVYTWYKYPYHGKAQLLQDALTKENESDIINMTQIREEYAAAEQEFNRVSQDSQEAYIQNVPSYTEAKQKYQQYNKDLIINKNICYNYPISSIVISNKISCVVTEDNNYVGTGSITLQNRLQFSGMYSLSIENGTQVFQYDNKGNSPTSKQLEKPLQIKPLTFTLIDDKGKEIPFEQIVNNGYVKWLIPKTNTLLNADESKETKKFPEDKDQLVAIGVDREFLDLGYDIYQNIPSFVYDVNTNYDKKLNQNDIRLNIKYKDVILDAYTDFTFPKDGDPGTNGTDFVAKLSIPGTDRVYVRNDGSIYDDNGSAVMGTEGKLLEFSFYNDSNKVENINSNDIIWQCPPKSDESYYKQKSYFSVNGGIITYSKQPPINIEEDLPVNIVRAKYSLNGINYYAEYPICYSYNINADTQYRFKIKPKTGFKYVVYSQDGTRPDYDNTLPFEVIVEEYTNNYWIRILDDDLSYSWRSIGDFLERQEVQDLPSYKAWFKPVDNFDGLELYSAIVCDITKDGQYLGFIHIPIYMILNRYGHQALNDWDGNSIQLNDAGNTILAPQIGAGKKDDENGFTGVFMGVISGYDPEIDTDNLEQSKQEAAAKGFDVSEQKIGFAGYHHGARTIFLDSKTGKAEFGKNNAGKIILDPSQKINEKDAALIYSGNYPIDQFIENPNVETVGDQVDKNNQRRTEGGMLIDLSTPQIGFGSGNFTVTKEGYITAKGGGHIAGWSILDDQLHYHNEVGMASKNKAVPFKSLKNGDSDTIAFWAGGTPITTSDNNKTNPLNLTDANFYATHGGFIFGKLGQIARWNFDNTRFYSDNNLVGMSSVNDNTSKYPIKINNKTQYKAFFANDEKFYVTHDGYLRSISGKIASWDISETALTNGTTGMGQLDLNQKDNKTNKYFGEPSIKNARFWSNNPETNETVFAVDSSGKLFSRAGKIGGWTIGDTSLSAKGITISSNGSISAGEWENKNSKSGWGITSEGNAYFNKGTIGTVVMDGSGIADKNDNWHIYTGNIKIPWLKVNENNYVTYNNSSSGSAAGGGVAGNGMAIRGKQPSYVDPTKVLTDSDSIKTLKGYMNELIVENLYANSITGGLLKIYGKRGINENGDKNFEGVPLIQATSTQSLYLGNKDATVIITADKFYFDGNEMTGSLLFSNGAAMHFSTGIFTSFDKPGKHTVNEMSWGSSHTGH